jgi:hypothetical protein
VTAFLFADFESPNQYGFGDFDSAHFAEFRSFKPARINRAGQELT